MAVSGPTPMSASREVRTTTPNDGPGPQSRATDRTTSDYTPGGGRPDDFGPGGGPDFIHDGTVSDAEASAYHDRLESDDRRYTADVTSQREATHDEEITRREEMQEKHKDYRAELQSATAQNASNNDNKMHKMFGKQSAPVQMPTPPSDAAA